MPFFDPIRIGASGAVADFTVDRSLRFNDNDSHYLTRTPSSASNRKTFTFSVWVKRTGISLNQRILTAYNGSDHNHECSIQFQSDDKIQINNNYNGSTDTNLKTNRLFRDPSAWYHIVLAVDMTQSTASDRVNLYVNGVQETSFSTENYGTQNYTWFFNNNSLHSIGRRPTGERYYDGYMAEINFIDGQALTPSSFGETNSTTGQWVPINTSGLTFGTNGFRLQFADNSNTTATTLGKDTSGNGHNFTPNNFAVSDSITDTPSKNFCTLNPLNATNDVDLREGNLEFFQSSNDESATATFGITSGKWYWEVYKNSSENPELGIDTLVRVLSSKSDDVSNTKVTFRTNGGDQQNGAGSAISLTGSSSGQTGAGVIAIAVDFDNKKIWYSDLSGNFFNSGNPATGSNAALDFSSVAVANGCVPYVFIGTGGSNSCNVNFGQDGTFAGHTTAGGYADGNGHGNFKYSVPSGYLALCSANLPDPTILLPNKHFDTLLWSGNATTSDRSITGLNFQPDWAWTKTRNHAYHHALFDAVRGSTNILNSDQDFAENHTNGGKLASFDAPSSGNNDGGITWDYGTGNNDTRLWWNVSGKNYLSWNWNAGDTDGKTYTVKVVSDSGNKYRFDDFGTSAVTLDLAEGGTYIFDQSDSSNAGHPLRFYTAADKTGGEYTTGVTTSGTAGSSGATVTITIAASAPTLYYQCSSHAGMGGAINTNSTLGSSNFDGSIQAVVKANAAAGFSIISFTGNGSSGSTVGHGLGVTPNFCIMKNRDTTGLNWVAASFDLEKARELNNSNAFAEGDYDAFFASQPSSTVLTLGNNDNNNKNNEKIIGYVFSEVAGYSKISTYVGNGSIDGTFVYTGFRPAWIMTKNTDTGSTWWFIYDVKRETYNPQRTIFGANVSDAEYYDNAYKIDILSNGFKARGTQPEINKSGSLIIYLAFAESPFKNARAR